MTFRALPGVTLLGAIALVGCAVTAPTTEQAQPEGRVNAAGPNALPSGALSANAGAPGSSSTTYNPTTGQTRPNPAAAQPTAGPIKAVGQAPVVDGGVPTKAVAAGDVVGTTLLLAPGEALPNPQTPRLDGATGAATPTPAPTPTPSPTPAPNDTPGTTQVLGSPAPSFGTAPNFLEVRTFSTNASVQVLDFLHVMVVDGTTLYATADGGATWTVFQNVGRQPLRCLIFSSPAAGWVAGDNGALLRVTISGTTLGYQVKNSGTASPVDALYYSPVGDPAASNPAQTLFVADEDASQLRKSYDDAQTWASAIAKDTRVTVSRVAGFRPDTGNGAFFLTSDPVRAPGSFTTLAQLQNGLFTPLSNGAKPATQSFGSVTWAGSLGISKDNAQPTPTWYNTTDWKTFTTFSADMLTPSQLIHGGLDAAYLVDAATLLGATRDGKLAVSADLGLTWSEAVTVNHVPGYLWPISTSQIWGFDASRGTLFRSGS